MNDVSAHTPADPPRISLGAVHWVGFKTIVIREYGRIMRIWGQTLVPSAVNMTLYFIIFGNLIGRRVGKMGGHPFIQFLAPGLIMMAIITNSYANVVSSFFSAKFGKHVEEMLVSPLSDSLIVAGYVAGGLMRGLLVGLVVTCVSLFFTHLSIAHAVIVVSAAVLTAIVFSLGGFINALVATNFDQISYFQTFLLQPLTYLGGVFYSVQMLPGWARTISYANPILYMVNAFRYGFFGISDVALSAAFSIMILASVVLFVVAVYLMRRATGIRE